MDRIDIAILLIINKIKLCYIVYDNTDEVWSRINVAIKNNDDIIIREECGYLFILLRNREGEWLKILNRYI